MRLHVFALLLIIANGVSSAGPQCPTGWESGEFLNKCYKFFIQRMNWRDAENFCRQQGTGGHLVSIHSRFENNAVIDFATNTPGSDSQEAWWWVGLNNLNAANFAWADGSQSNFAHWAQGEPSNTQAENCVCMSDVKSDCPSCWHTRGCGTCNNNRHFMCERNAFLPPNTT